VNNKNVVLKHFAALITALMLLVSTSSLFAKPLEDEAKMDSASETFMAQVAMGETDAALSLISAYIGVDPLQFQQRGEKIISDMKQITASAGKPISHALLKKQSVDGHFYKITYLLKFPRAALVWELNFYQANKGWHLVDVGFNTNINALFED
jgi:hypothetical protein